MIPGGVPSSTPVPTGYLYQQPSRAFPLRDYEPGGPVLNVGSAQRDLLWTLEYRDGAFYVGRPGVPEVVVHTASGVLQCSLAFDQVMQPVLAWRTATSAYLYWFDLEAGVFVTTDLGDVRTPRVAMEFDTGEVLLTYLRAGNVCLRQQSNKYATETIVAPGATDIVCFGMAANYRMQWKLAMN